MIAAESASMLPARITSRHRSRPVISCRKPALAATRRPRRLRLSAVARPADSATGRSPTLADRHLPANPPPPPAIGDLYPPNAYVVSRSSGDGQPRRATRFRGRPTAAEGDCPVRRGQQRRPALPWLRIRLPAWPGNDHRIGSHRDHRKGGHLVSKKCPLWGVTSLDRRGGPRCRVRLGGGELVAPDGGELAACQRTRGVFSVGRSAGHDR